MKLLDQSAIDQATVPAYRIEVQPLAPELTSAQLEAIAERVAAKLSDLLVPVKGLTPVEACQILGCSHPTLIALEREGLLRPFRHGTNFTRYDQRQIARLLSTGCGIERDDEAAA